MEVREEQLLEQVEEVGIVRDKAEGKVKMNFSQESRKISWEGGSRMLFC
jgi:hypothetical protein